MENKRLSATFSYLQMYKYYQELERAVSKINKEFYAVMAFLHIIDTDYGKMMMPDVNERNNLKERFKTSKEMGVLMQFDDVSSFLKIGNARNIVYCLLEEEGLTAKEFGEKINFEEKEITDFLEKGAASFDLLAQTCEYFGIEYSSTFSRYVY